MSERADADVRGEQQQQRSSSRVSGATSRQQQQHIKQQQLLIQRGGGGDGGGAAGSSSTAMATVAAERRSLPSPEIMLGQPWSNWVDAAKLHGNDGAADSEESFKDLGKNREAMRLYREDMPIFGQCPAQDDFFLVMCSHCSQVVKPQAFQAHYERRHSSAIKPPSAFPLSARNRSSSGVGAAPGLSSTASSGGVQGGRPSTAGSGVSSSATPSKSKPLKPAKETLPGIQRRSHFPPFRVLQPDRILSPAVKVEKMNLKSDMTSAKLTQAPSAPASTSSTTTTSSSSNSTTVSSNTTAPTSSNSSSSALKPGLNCPSIPKPPVLAPGGHIPNGKGHLSASLADKKQQQQQDSSASSRRHLYKRLSEREFQPDIHCGVMDITARKPCTRSLTCKTHSLGQRRAVPGRRKRFDTLLAEHKNRAREREREIHPPLHSQQPPTTTTTTTPALRDPHHPSPHRLSSSSDPHQAAHHGNGPAPDATAKPLPLGKPKPHNAGLPRLNSSHGGGGPPGDPSLVHESTHHPPTAPDGFSRPSSDEGENEEREEGPDKLDCHYSGYHPRPAAYCTFGSRLFGRSCYSFDRRWDRMRCALTAMMDKHVNSQMWKKIPLALENSSSSSVAPAHRTSTNSHGSTPSSGFLGPPATPPPQPPYGPSSALSYGTTLNMRSSPQGPVADGTAQARPVSSSPQMPSAHSSSSSSSAPSLAASGRALKSRSASSTSSSITKSSSSSFRPRESSSSSSAPVTPSSTPTPTPNTPSITSSTISSGKKRKNSSLLSSSSSHGSSESSSSNANYSSSSFKKNCAAGSALGGSGVSGSSGAASSYHHGPAPASSAPSGGVHSVGLSCGPTARTNSLSLKAEGSSTPSSSAAGGPTPPARGPPPASPAESIKRMSVVMNSSDSTLSLGPFVHHHQENHHHPPLHHNASSVNDGGQQRLEGKKRKSQSPAASGGGGPGGGGGGAGGPGPGRPKVTKSPATINNNIHGKHGRSAPGTPGIPNNSHIHQPKARP